MYAFCLRVFVLGFTLVKTLFKALSATVNNLLRAGVPGGVVKVK